MNHHLGKENVMGELEKERGVELDGVSVRRGGDWREEERGM